MSLLLVSAAVATGVLLGRWIVRSRSPEKLPPPEEPTVEPQPRSKAAPRKAPAGKDPLAEFPCRLGDVVIARGGEEAWLAGALLFFEQASAAALFVAPEAGGDRALYVRPKPNAQIVWLAPVAAGELAVGLEPPSSLEHRGERFERTRRLPLRVERAGTGAPDVGEQAIVAEYSSGAERLLVVSGGGVARAWRGVLLEDGTYDVLPAGSATLST